MRGEKFIIKNEVIKNFTNAGLYVPSGIGYLGIDSQYSILTVYWSKVKSEDKVKILELLKESNSNGLLYSLHSIFNR